MVSGKNMTTKRHILARKHALWHYTNLFIIIIIIIIKSVYERWRSTIPRIKKGKGHLRNQNIRRDHPRCRSATWICMCCHTRDIVMYSRFHQNLFCGFGAMGVKICPFPLLWLLAFTTACTIIDSSLSKVAAINHAL